MEFSQFYRFIDSNFSVKQFQQHLSTEYIGRYFYHVQETTSTMDLMEVLAHPKLDNSTSNTIVPSSSEQGAPTGFLILADKQTQGRGRKGRTWTSEPAENLYVSILIRLEQSQFQHLIKLNLALGIAIVKACHEFGATEARIKWPNDVWIPVSSSNNNTSEYGQYRKLSGMLVNSSQYGNQLVAVCGLGINVNQQFHFNEQQNTLTNVATSLRDVVGKSIQRELVLASICNHIEELMTYNMEQVIEIYKKYDLLIGKKVLVHESKVQIYEATAIGYSKFGNLQVELSDGSGVKELISEEVSIRL
jgi:BirA family biotin operon repressor/biotin-[acetyl-CoA-carboxylase] ligase